MYYWRLTTTSRYTEAHMRPVRDVSVKWPTKGKKYKKKKKIESKHTAPLKNHRLPHYHCVDVRILTFFHHNLFFARVNNRYKLAQHVVAMSCPRASGAREEFTESRQQEYIIVLCWMRLWEGCASKKKEKRLIIFRKKICTKTGHCNHYAIVCKTL